MPTLALMISVKKLGVKPSNGNKITAPAIAALQANISAAARMGKGNGKSCRAKTVAKIMANAYAAIVDQTAPIKPILGIKIKFKLKFKMTGKTKAQTNLCVLPDSINARWT